MEVLALIQHQAFPYGSQAPRFFEEFVRSLNEEGLRRCVPLSVFVTHTHTLSLSLSLVLSVLACLSHLCLFIQQS
jgi:hypothetical protein